MPSFLTPPRSSTTALGAPIDKLCENPSCGRIFQTCEPQRLYCSLRCKDYAARRRRRLKDRLQDEGHDPRAGQTERERNAHHLAAARAAATTRDFDLEFKALLRGIELGQGIPKDLHPEVAKRLLAHQLHGVARAESEPEADIVAGGSESVLADLGFIRPAEGPKVDDDDEPDEGTLASEL